MEQFQWETAEEKDKKLAEQFAKKGWKGATDGFCTLTHPYRV